MFVPTLWLKDYIDIQDDIHAFTRMMTLSGTMVEGYEYRGGEIKNVVTAKVTEIKHHPDSDHMWVCHVFDGEETYTIVTGAQNVKKDDIVPLARNNSLIYSGKEIKTAPLRGIESAGMLCSAEELGIRSGIAPKHAENGIYILPNDTPLGKDIKEILGLDDHIVEFELTNNRQDCNSILGIAYEAAASQGKKFEFPAYEYDSKAKDIDNYLKVDVKNYELCSRYTAKMVKVVKIEQSPLWLQVRLMGSGVRPINNVVDVSNFVMLETGQPLHTFDYDKIGGHEIIVATAEKNDSTITLDGVHRELNENVLMINDANGHIGIAGIMGGGNSDIDDNTKYVVIEAANFNKSNIRNSAKFLGLRTEASAHFEKGISPYLTKYAADRAASLLVEIGACEYIDGVIDKYENLPKQNEVCIDMDWYNRFIGTDLSVEEATHYLDNLLMQPEINENTIKITSPKFRQDIEIKEDVAEEITRMYGYARIPQTMMESSKFISEPNAYYKAKQTVKRLLISVGGYDTLTYSFVSPSVIKAFRFKDDDKRSMPETLINPLGVDNSIMRTTALTGILENIKTNYNRKNKPHLMFELANSYLSADNEIDLPQCVEKLVLGKFESDFYEIKSVLQYLFTSLKIENIEYQKAQETYLHPGRSAYVYLNGVNIGSLGQIHPLLAKDYDICENTCVAELELKPIIEAAQAVVIISKPLAKYPAVERDLALVADDAIQAGDIKQVIKENAGEFLQKCDVFDIYKHQSLGEGKKSIAFNLMFRSDDFTLKDELVDGSIENILKALKEKLNITLR